MTTEGLPRASSRSTGTTSIRTETAGGGIHLPSFERGPLPKPIMFVVQ
jgi:hypothetical protein